MQFLNRFREALVFTPGSVPWRRMAQFGASVALALTAGLVLGTPGGAAIAAFGAMYVFFLDFGGPLNYRYPTILLGLIVILLCAILGRVLHGLQWEKIAAVFILSFIAGGSNAAGPRILQVLRYGAVALLVCAVLPDISVAFLPYVLLGAGIGFAVTLVEDGLFGWPARTQPGSLWLETRRIPDYHRVQFRFAFWYALVAAAGLLGGELLGASRPYWICITTLFAMQPDAALSLARMFQRIIGTLMAVPVTALAIEWSHSIWLVAAVAVVMAFIVPYGFARNYWFGCAAIVVFVIAVLDLVYFSQGGAMPLLWMRVYETILGCVLASAGTFIAFPEVWRPRKRAAAG
ncbi:MAG: FUSC family protein [Gammaproteobacteria bacterium]